MVEVAVGLSVLALAGALFAVTRTTPARVLASSRECADSVAKIEAEWREERVRLASFLEELGNVAEQIERRRRQVSAAASRLGQNGAGSEPDLSRSSPEEVRAYYTGLARQRGLM